VGCRRQRGLARAPPPPRHGDRREPNHRKAALLVLPFAAVWCATANRLRCLHAGEGGMREGMDRRGCSRGRLTRERRETNEREREGRMRRTREKVISTCCSWKTALFPVGRMENPLVASPVLRNRYTHGEPRVATSPASRSLTWSITQIAPAQAHLCFLTVTYMRAPLPLPFLCARASRSVRGAE
jgi:hypothetical protein